MYTLSDFIKEFGNPKRIITRRKRNANDVYTDGIIVKKGDFL